MADYTLPRGRRQFGGSLNIPGMARRLPNAYGTDAYQAGVTQDRESTLGRLVSPAGSQMTPVPSSSSANDQLRAEQTQALAQHAQYRQRLSGLEDANQLRQNDLKLAENLLVATDPTM